MVEKKRTSKTNRKQPAMRSFRLSPPSRPFVSFKLTQQTFYWVIICLFVLALGIWVTILSVKVQDIYDRIDKFIIMQESSSSR